VAPSHEELFVRHYEQFYAWALRLTDHDRQQAEDLVHDVFIQFTLSQPDLDQIENLEGYLFAMLRNLLRSQMRREIRRPGGALNLVDYDSAETGLRFIDPRYRIQAREDLRRICQYACARKETSRAGSALILRFFLGYYPGEIARVFRNSPHAVAELINVARREARLSLDHPGRLGFVSAQPAARATRPGLAVSPDDFLGELSVTVFRACQGVCLPEWELLDCYRRSGSKAPAHADTKTLAHLVSCPRCLDLVNRELELPPLADRYPTDTIGPDRPDSGGKDDSGGGPTDGGAGAGSAQDAVRKFRRRLREVVEHEPKELRVAVNGQMLGTLTVNAEINRLNLHLEETEKISFIEVFSEQGFRLFFLNVAPPPEGSFEQQARAVFSHQRTLQVALDFNGPGADLEVVYQAQPEAATIPTALAAVEKSPDGNEDDAEQTPHRVLDLLRSRLFNPGFWLRPGVLTAVTSVVLIAALLLIRLPESKVSAAEVLRRAAVAEAGLAHRADLALRHTFSLEENDPASGRIIARRRVEVWQSARQGVKVRRLYDEKNQLIAGEWRGADGARTIYRRGAKPNSQAGSEAGPLNPLASIEDAWQLEMASSDFAALLEDVNRAVVEEAPATYTITWQKDAESDGQASRLIRATLVLTRPDLRPVEQRLVVEREGTRREYRFIEIGSDRYPHELVPPAAFQLDPELLGATGVELPPATEPVAAPPEIRLLPASTPEPPHAPVNASLEVNVIYLLAQENITLGEQAALRRGPDSTLTLRLTVENERRRESILQTLAPAMSDPALTVEITVAPGEGAAPVSPSSPERVEEAAARLIAHTARARAHALALRHTGGRFSPDQANEMDAETRGKWLTMLSRHAAACESEIVSLRREVEAAPGFSAPAGLDQEQATAIDVASLPANIERLVKLAAAHETAVRAAFAAPRPKKQSAVRERQLYRSLREAEALAASIRGLAERLQ